MACELKLQIRESDGYINATSLGKSGGKRFFNYIKSDNTQTFLNKISVKLQIPLSDLIVYKRGSPGIRGGGKSWVHPQVATHFAAWISSDFAACVSGWIEQAKAALPNVNAEYKAQLESLEADGVERVEARVRDALAQRLNGNVEVSCLHGRIDVVTELEVIEVKHAPKYLHALGQVLGYSESYPNKTLRIHLFGTANEVTPELLQKVNGLVSQFKIVVTHEIV